MCLAPTIIKTSHNLLNSLCRSTGIWHNDAKNFLVWVNEEDHLRVISMQKGGNMREVNFEQPNLGPRSIADTMNEDTLNFN